MRARMARVTQPRGSTSNSIFDFYFLFLFLFFLTSGEEQEGREKKTTHSNTCDNTLTSCTRAVSTKTKTTKDGRREGRLLLRVTERPITICGLRSLATNEK